VKLNVLDLGLCDYKEALDIQYELLEKVQKGEINDTLILVEHPSVITLGRNAVEGNILFSEEWLKERGIDLYKINRGGDVTYHGPGQLVGYPIFNLRKNHGSSIKTFISKLEDVFIEFVKSEFDLEVGRHQCNTGVWFGEEKLVAMGLAVKRGVTMHGFAFNINTILEHFQLIVPCGLSDKGVTSLEKILGEKASIEDIKEKIVGHFVKQYSFDEIEAVEKR